MLCKAKHQASIDMPKWIVLYPKATDFEDLAEESGEFMYRRLREEFYSLEETIRSLSKLDKTSAAPATIG